MKQHHFTWPLLGFVAAAFACAESPPPEAQAAKVAQQQCKASRSRAADVALLHDVQVLRAAPLYSYLSEARDDAGNRVIGARLLVRPPPGVSAEILTRALQCHSARALLGQVETSQFVDPFWLPGAWLDIDVKPEDGNFSVELRASSVSEGLQTFHSATAFAESHPSHTAR